MKRVKENSKVAMLIAMFAMVFTSTAFAQQKGSLTDTRDKKKYKTVKIGEQTWMAENLNFVAEGSKCYDGKDANCKKYGRLYDWETAMKSCPSGWHLPSIAEWDALYRFADGTSGTKSPYYSETAGKFLKAKTGWDKNNDGKSGNGTDKFGFSALPGGRDDSAFGEGSKFAGGEGYWWTATGSGGSESYYAQEMTKDFDSSGARGGGGKYLHSVRCLQD